MPPSTKKKQLFVFIGENSYSDGDGVSTSAMRKATQAWAAGASGRQTEREIPGSSSAPPLQLSPLKHLSGGSSDNVTICSSSSSKDVVQGSRADDRRALVQLQAAV